MKKPSLTNRFLGPKSLSFSPRSGACVLLLGAALLFGIRLGHLDFWAPDEPRYGAIAEELRSFRHGASGLVLLHLNDAPYTQKPPLYFWLAALAGSPAGFVSEWAARLPSALAGLGCVGLTLLVGRRMLGNPIVALLAAGILATSFRFAFTARRAQLDVLLTGFELMAIAIFVFSEFRRSAADNANPTHPLTRIHPSTLAIAGLHTALGAAALVKGPVGWLPLGVMAVYLSWEGRFRSLRSYVPLWSLALSLGPICLWIAGAIALAPSGFAETAVVENLIGRFFSGTSHARPFYYFLLQMPADFMPWTLLLPLGVIRVGTWLRNPISGDSARMLERRSALRLLLTWIAVPLLFFSLSAGKRGVYLLPIFPALALLTAIGTSPLCEAHSKLTSRFTSRATSEAMRWALLGVGVVAVLELGLFAFAAPLLETEKSPRPIAETIARESEPGEPIGVYGLEPIEGAITYYGDRPVISLADPDALRRFVLGADRRRLVLLRSRHFESLGPALGLKRLAGFRSAPRTLVLAAHSGENATERPLAVPSSKQP